MCESDTGKTAWEGRPHDIFYWTHSLCYSLYKTERKILQTKEFQEFPQSERTKEGYCYKAEIIKSSTQKNGDSIETLGSSGKRCKASA